MNIVERVGLCYARAVEIIGPAPYVRTRYSYGGGHPGFGPSFGILQDTHVLGLDCSGFGSDVLHAGGLLGKPPVRASLDTAEFASWAEEGPGKLLTVWVRNDAAESGVHHMRLEFHNHERSAGFCEAPHDGAFCNWLDGVPDLSDYAPRHWAPA